jgi:hypothetical protein
MFHDAEVTSAVLDSSGPVLTLAVTTFVGTPRQQLLLLRFRGIGEVELAGFNEQNVLFDIYVDEVPGAGGGFRFRQATD